MKFSKKGFTLIELMVVIVIVGILAAVAIPKFVMASYKAKCSEYPTILMQCYTAEIAYEAEAGTYASMGDIGVSVGTSKWFSYAVAPRGASYSTGFTATATSTIAIGSAPGGSTATIDETASKGGTAALLAYTSNWP